jgi:hypothetical protein
VLLGCVVILSVIMLSVIMLSVIILSVIMLSVVMLSVIVLTLVVLSVVMVVLSVVVLSVVSPIKLVRVESSGLFFRRRQRRRKTIADVDLKDECVDDEDCGRHGKCIDIEATSAPRTQCYKTFYDRN